MKRPALLIALPLLAASVFAGYRFMMPADVPAVVESPTPASPPAVTTDPAAVFQRAFWKRPGPDDKILHAERREWSGQDGVSRWQWFIAVQPSETLRRHLREDNPFGLLVRESASLPGADAPDWFPRGTDGFDIRQSPGGSMTLLFHRTTGEIHATDSGGGFAPGFTPPPAPAPAPAVTQHTGRLPNAPPPTRPR